MTPKEQNKLSILNYIYKNGNCKLIEHIDKPDFKILVNNHAFGVEVTDFFACDTNARLTKIPTYAEELLDQQKFRHKKDKQILKVDEIELHKEDGTKFKTDAIIRNGLSQEVFQKRIREDILRKESCFNDYDPNLSHINLIIYDNTGQLNDQESNFYNYFYNRELIQTIAQSSFREIFFVYGSHDRNKHVKN